MSSERRRRHEPALAFSARLLSVASLVGWLGLLALQGCAPSKPSDDSTGIPIGVLLPFTGELSAYGADYERALILAEERVNQAGGVAGRKIHLVARDTHSNVERGLDSVQELLDLGVAAVIGPEEPEITLGMAPLLSSYGVTQILPTLSSPRSAGRTAKADWFHIAPGPRLLGCMLGTRLYNDGRAHVVVANENDPFLFAMGSSAVSNYNTLLKPGSDSYRTTAALLPFQSGQKSYVELISSVTRRDADSLVLLGYPESGAKIVAGWDVSGNGAPLYLAPTLQSRAFQLNCPPNSLEGSLGIGVDLPADRAAFAAAFAERWAGAEPMPMAYFYYDALVLWALAAESAAVRGADFPENAVIQQKLVEVSKAGPNAVAWNEVEKGLRLAASGVGIDYQGASGTLDLGDDGELAVRGGATFWTIRGEEVFAEKAGACESAKP